MTDAKFIPATLFLAFLAFPVSVAAGDEPKALVFDLELVDTSQEGLHPDHPGRLERVTAVLRDGLLTSGRFDVVGIHDTPLAAEVPASLEDCNGCERDLGRRAGADIVVTGVIRKISSLILNIRLIMRDVGTGEIVGFGFADIRGDNERSWQRGVEWLVRHRLLSEEP